MDIPDNETLKQIMFHLPLFRQVFLVDTREFFSSYPDLKPSHIHAMMFLMVNGETTMTRLSSLLRMEKGSLTSVAERLVSFGLAERQTDPEDRRKSVLRLTDAGRGLAASLRLANARQFEQRIGRLDAEGQAAFARCLSEMNDLLRQMLDPSQLHCLNPHHLPAGHNTGACPMTAPDAVPMTAPDTVPMTAPDAVPMMASDAGPDAGAGTP